MSEQIDQFFRPDGTLFSIPVKPAKKIAVLTHIAQELSPTTKYPEKELNLIIAKYHDDTAAFAEAALAIGENSDHGCEINSREWMCSKI